MWFLLAIAWLAIQVGADESFSSRGIGVLNYDTRGVSCAPVYSDPSMPNSAFIDIKVTLLEPIDKKKNMKWLDTYTIPLLILRQSDTYNFSEALAPHTYDYNYEDRLKGLDNNKHNMLVDHLVQMFTLTPVVDQKINSRKILNSNFTILTPIRFMVQDSGIYCVYISPPTDQGIKNLQVLAVFRNSYGYLPYWSYILMRQTKTAIIIGLVQGALMLQALALHRFSSTSIVSRTLFFFVFLPFITLLALEWYTYNAMNLHRPRAYITHKYFRSEKVIEIAKNLHSIVINYLILLFAMGYGVVYYDSRKKVKPFPQNLWNVAQSILAANVLVVLACDGIGYLLYNYKFEVQRENIIVQRINPMSNELIFLNSVQALLSLIANAFSLVWYFLTIFYYIRTIGSMGVVQGKYNGPFQNPVAKGVAKSFRHTFLFILVIPILSYFLTVMFSAFYANDAPQLYANDWRSKSHTAIRVSEDRIFDHTYETFCFWSLIADVYLMMYVIYIMWIKDNIGLGKIDIHEP